MDKEDVEKLNYINYLINCNCKIKNKIKKCNNDYQIEYYKFIITMNNTIIDRLNKEIRNEVNTKC